MQESYGAMPPTDKPLLISLWNLKAMGMDTAACPVICSTLLKKMTPSAKTTQLFQIIQL